MFTDREIEIIWKTWMPVAEAQEASARLFYGRLFEVAPELKPLFTADMKDQGRRFFDMLGMAVHNLDRLETIIPPFEALGDRHDRYGARPEHYPVIGAVLLDTLDARLGDAFTEEARKAWTRTYEILASVMAG